MFVHINDFLVLILNTVLPGPFKAFKRSVCWATLPVIQNQTTEPRLNRVGRQ